MKEISIITAILLEIKNQGDDSFSIYNITEAIRDSVGNQMYELSESGTSVYHDDVKKGFQEVYENGLLEDYDTQANGLYREFKRKSAVGTQSVKPQSNQPLKLQQSSKMPLSIQAMILGYINNRSGLITMKQIQSRLKGYGCTCEDIKDYLTSIGRIDSKTAHLPASKVCCF